jgi:DNA-binding transcriptional regulator YhcF (GntR family)
MLSANIDDVEWCGMVIKRGSLVSSIRHLATQTGLTEQQVRTALKHLVSTKEITKLSRKSFTIVTLVNYDKYQAVNTQTPHEDTNNQSTDSSKLTHDSDKVQQQYKNIRSKKKEERNKSISSSPLGDDDFRDDDVDDIYNPNHDFGYIPKGKDF